MKKNIKKIVLLLITFVFLYFVFSNLDIKELLRVMKGFDARYIPLLVLSIIISQTFRATCFKQLISKTVKIPLKEATHLCITSSALNIMLPARAGDIFRAFFVGQKYNVEKLKIFGSVMFERIFDVFTIFCLLIIGILIYNKNDTALYLCIFSGIIIILGIIFIIITYKYNKTDKICEFIKTKTKSFPFSDFIGKAIDFTNQTCKSFFNGFEIIDSPKKILYIIVSSFFIWMFEGICFLIAMHGFGYNVHWSVAIFIICFIAMACMIPSTSIFIGPYQFAVISAFAIYNVNKETALAISFFEQAIVIITTTVIATLFLIKNNISFSSIKENMKKDKL